MRRSILPLLCGMFLLAACSVTAPVDTPTTSAEELETGESLIFVANGEDFVRQGFESKDGWQIEFDHLYVTLADMAAYQTDPPFDASSGDMPDGDALAVAGPVTVDLAEGDEDAAPLVVGEVDAAPAGQYNALAWRMEPAADGPAAGATIALMGSAAKDGVNVDFAINDASEYAYTCGEFVGDTRKGILAAGQTAEMEATFHFDHIFGDADAPADDALNQGALGFEPLAALAQDGVLELSITELAELLDAEENQTLVDTLASLGHVGEGHCYEATGGYTGHNK